MTEGVFVLLFGSEPEVIRDVTCSLRLVDISVHSVGNVGDAERRAKELRPKLILARIRVAEDGSAGLRLARALAADQELQEIPVVALCTSGEQSMAEQQPGLFEAELTLPVEFPQFTVQVQQILSAIDKRGFAKGRVELGGTDAGRPSAPPGDTVGKGGNLVASDVVLRQKLLLVQDVQNFIFKNLLRDDRFWLVEPEAIPQLVAEIAQEAGSLSRRR